MPDAEFTLRDDFPPASYDQWRALAEADLKGALFQQKLVTSARLASMHCGTSSAKSECLDWGAQRLEKVGFSCAKADSGET
jgi:hypothetical protein